MLLGASEAKVGKEDVIEHKWETENFHSCLVVTFCSAIRNTERFHFTYTNLNIAYFYYLKDFVNSIFKVFKQLDQRLSTRKGLESLIVRFKLTWLHSSHPIRENVTCISKHLSFSGFLNSAGIHIICTFWIEQSSEWGENILKFGVNVEWLKRTENKWVECSIFCTITTKMLIVQWCLEFKVPVQLHLTQDGSITRGWVIAAPVWGMRER